MFTDINLPPLRPDADNNFDDSLVLDFQQEMMTSRATQEYRETAFAEGYNQHIFYLYALIRQTHVQMP